MGIGEAIFQQSAMTRYSIDGRDIYPIPQEVAVDLESLILWRDWIEGCGGRVKSKTGTAFSLLRASLDAPIHLNRGNVPDIPTIIGGRVHSCIGFDVLPEIEIWDISAAYARTLAAMRVDGKWKEAKLDLDSNAEQFAWVAVRVPEMEHGPLPERERNAKHFGLWWDIFAEREFPTGTVVSGVWSADELRAAVNIGCKIIRRNAAYKLYASSREPFARWWENVQLGRSLPAKAAALAKITGNVLWGCFAPATGKRKSVRYANRPGWKREKIVKLLDDLPASRWRRDLALAELVTSKVRAKVYNEAMTPANGQLVSVCVDGGLFRPGFTPTGQHWRLKDRGSACAFLKPYIYAHRRDDGQVVYKVAGVPERHKAAFFQATEAQRFDHRQIGNGNPTEKKVALHRLSEGFPGSCIDRSA